MISAKEFFKKFGNNSLQEQAKAVEGDLEDYEVDDYDDTKTLDQKYDRIYIISKTVVETQWILLGTIIDKYNNKYNLHHNKYMKDSYIITGLKPIKELNPNGKEGYEYDLVYNIICKISLDKQQDLESKLDIKNLYRVMEILIIPKARGASIAKNLYKFFIKNLKLTILGDSEQYFGARKLWANLSKDSDIIVDIVDIYKGSYMEKNTIIHHGDLDGEFDKRIWSRKEDKLHIRTLLRDIK